MNIAELTTLTDNSIPESGKLSGNALDANDTSPGGRFADILEPLAADNAGTDTAANTQPAVPVSNDETEPALPAITPANTSVSTAAAELKGLPAGGESLTTAISASVTEFTRTGPQAEAGAASGNASPVDGKLLPASRNAGLDDASLKTPVADAIAQASSDPAAGILQRNLAGNPELNSSGVGNAGVESDNAVRSQADNAELQRSGLLRATLEGPELSRKDSGRAATDIRSIPLSDAQAGIDPLQASALQGDAAARSQAAGLSSAAALTSSAAAIDPGAATTASLYPTDARSTNPTTEEGAGDRTPRLPMQSGPGQNGWGHEVQGRIQWLSRNGIQRAELQLHPAELGSLEVRISTDNDQTSVVFYSGNRAARELLEAEMPRLRELFGQDGVELGQTDVSQQSLAERNAAGNGESGQWGDRAADPMQLDSEGETQETGLVQDLSGDKGLIDYYI